MKRLFKPTTYVMVLMCLAALLMCLSFYLGSIRGSFPLLCVGLLMAVIVFLLKVVYDSLIEIRANAGLDRPE